VPPGSRQQAIEIKYEFSEASVLPQAPPGPFLAGRADFAGLFTAH
jgi:hypothetical protein